MIWVAVDDGRSGVWHIVAVDPPILADHRVTDLAMVEDVRCRSLAFGDRGIASRQVDSTRVGTYPRSSTFYVERVEKYQKNNATVPP